MAKLHLPAVEGFKWAKVNPETGLYEFFTCVDSGYFTASDYDQFTDEFVEQYIAERYPHEEEPETEEPQDSSVAVDTSVL